VKPRFTTLWGGRCRNLRPGPAAARGPRLPRRLGRAHLRPGWTCPWDLSRACWT